MPKPSIHCLSHNLPKPCVPFHLPTVGGLGDSVQHGDDVGQVELGRARVGEVQQLFGSPNAGDLFVDPHFVLPILTKMSRPSFERAKTGTRKRVPTIFP